MKSLSCLSGRLQEILTRLFGQSCHRNSRAKTVGCLAWMKYWDTFRGSLTPNKKPQKSTYVEHLDRLIQPIDDESRPSFSGYPRQDTSRCLVLGDAPLPFVLKPSGRVTN